MSLITAVIVLAGVSVSWAVVVDSQPESSRPYIGSSQTNSVLELAFGYNGIQRLTGQNGAGGAEPPHLIMIKRISSKAAILKTTQTRQMDKWLRRAEAKCLRADRMAGRVMSKAAAEVPVAAQAACLALEPRVLSDYSNLSFQDRLAG